MSMSASQARFLMLTAQKSNNEYQAQQITFERAQLADNVDRWTDEYNEAMQNEVLLFGQGDRSSNDYNYNARLTYEDIIRGISEGGMGMSLVAANSNRIVVPSLPSPEDMPEGRTEDDYFVCPEINEPGFLEKNIREGNFYFVKEYFYNFQRLSAEERQQVDRFTYTSNDIRSYVTNAADKTDDADAQALYNKRITDFHRADKLLECQLVKLETEHKALETEIESVEKVIKNNIETSFKTFA